MTGRAKFLAGLVFGCIVLLSPVVIRPDARLIFNATASAPLGFYWRDNAEPGVGELALVRPPPHLARWLAVRRYLPINVPLIKHVAAEEGQFVCIRNRVVYIDGVQIGDVLTHDRVGRFLSEASICRRLSADEVFLLNTAPRSLDGRYFGPLQRRDVEGRLTPVWTWGR
ncbi:S26 family signal peptidase [Caulobacter endophyticus]|uniref:Peptidase n=1 Tax=Caulobacter endophyticus TaxID=2172652 RepID=A0A2T9K9V3_9CAUL|nr:S26 family signal peptidase [Caulobacter endophyticus]PVM92760.1 peptidase [Caulobacter endophyticus]